MAREERCPDNESFFEISVLTYAWIAKHTDIKSILKIRVYK